MKNTRRTATLALTVSLALVLSFIESQIPAFVSIPGMKVGLANIAVIFALYKLGAREAIIVSSIRVVMLAILFGSVTSFLFSLTGAVLSFVLMLILKSLTPVGMIGVSVVGGVSHNVGQIAVACFLMETNIIIYYLPFLLISGTIAGIVIGIVSAFLTSRINIDNQKKGGDE